MRPIDADALVYSYCPIAPILKGDKEAWRFVLFDSDIDHAPTIDAVPRWIPCEERLPEEEGFYIVYAPGYFGGSSGGKEIHDGVMFSRWKNAKWSVEHGYHKRPNCVRAWMPLPDPYKGERKDDE